MNTFYQSSHRTSELNPLAFPLKWQESMLLVQGSDSFYDYYFSGPRWDFFGSSCRNGKQRKIKTTTQTKMMRVNTKNKQKKQNEISQLEGHSSECLLYIDWKTMQSRNYFMEMLKRDSIPFLIVRVMSLLWVLILLLYVLFFFFVLLKCDTRVVTCHTK